MESKEIDLGPMDRYETLPAEVMLGITPYWLVRCGEEEYRLLSALCPHAGGEVRPMNGVLICPLHFWTFDIRSGDCLSHPDERLMSRRVEARDGRFVAIGEDR